MKKIFLLIFIYLICASCVSSQNILPKPPADITNATVVYIDQDFSNQDKLSIENALSEWMCDTNYNVVFAVHTNTKHFQYYSYDENKSLYIWKTDSSDGRIVLQDGFEPKDEKGEQLKTIAFFTRVHNTPAIFIAYDRISNNLHQVVLHEVGHYILGNDHSATENSVMYFRLDMGTKHLTINDVHNFCFKYQKDCSEFHMCNISKEQ